MGATPEVKDEVQDELSAALEASKNPGKVEEEPEPESEPEVDKKEEKVEEPGEKKEDAKSEDAAKPAEKDELFGLEEQNRELRQILRQQKREVQIMQAKLERLEKRSTAATKKVEDEVEDDLFTPKKTTEKSAEVEEEVSPVEGIQQELLTIAKVKGPVLETLLEVMEVSPTYSDVREVCSQSNFDDIFEAVGEAIAAKEGKDASLAALEAEAAVWKMANPYKYMYGLIKKYHPKYANRQSSTKEDASAVVKKTVKKPADAPSSIADKSGKSTPSNAWTSARIDEMDELELDKVPAEIYEKYLRGELD